MLIAHTNNDHCKVVLLGNYKIYWNHYSGIKNSKIMQSWSSSSATSSHWQPSLKPFCWCWHIFVDHFWRKRKRFGFFLINIWFHFNQYVFYVVFKKKVYLLAHFDFVSASHSSLPVAAACTSCHHTPTAGARFSIVVRLPQPIWWRFQKVCLCLS